MKSHLGQQSLLTSLQHACLPTKTDGSRAYNLNNGLDRHCPSLVCSYFGIAQDPTMMGQAALCPCCSAACFVAGVLPCLVVVVVALSCCLGASDYSCWAAPDCSYLEASGCSWAALRPSCCLAAAHCCSCLVHSCCWEALEPCLEVREAYCWVDSCCWEVQPC